MTGAATTRAATPNHPSRTIRWLHPGLPDTGSITTPQWRAAWRAAAAHAGDLASAQPSYPGTPSQHLGSATAGAQGHVHLRQEIAHHLRLMRGLALSPDRIVITAGAREGLALLLRSLGPPNLSLPNPGLPNPSLRSLSPPSLAPAASAVSPPPAILGVEHPGYPSLRRIPQQVGWQVAHLATDNEGIAIPPSSGPDVVLVTPSHQHPYGGSMSAARRTQLAAWAAAAPARLIIEDDFDSELRYAGAPLPALTALAPECTALLGTFSSVLSPSIACGYLVLPPHIVPQVVAVRQLGGQPVSGIVQDAIARYLASGALRRHTAKMRRAYRRRRDIVLAALQPASGAQVHGISGGLHAVVITKRRAADIAADAAAAGVGVTTLAQYWDDPAAPEGIVIGFGHIAETELAALMAVLRDVLDRGQ